MVQFLDSGDFDGEKTSFTRLYHDLSTTTFGLKSSKLTPAFTKLKR
jgi:hypothetical protein